jgi:hypothetical protein
LLSIDSCFGLRLCAWGKRCSQIGESHDFIISTVHVQGDQRRRLAVSGLIRIDHGI